MADMFRDTALHSILPEFQMKLWYMLEGWKPEAGAVSTLDIMLSENPVPRQITGVPHD